MDAFQIFFSMGGPASGLAYHEHEEAWCAVMVGAKLWTVQRPLGELLEDEAVHEQQCLQESGDLLYLPPHYQHRVQNIGEVVSVSGLRKDSEESSYVTAKMERNDKVERKRMEAEAATMPEEEAKIVRELNEKFNTRRGAEEDL